MAKYHINPKTGEVGECHAEQGKCPFGSPSNHFTSFEKAQETTDTINKSIIEAHNKLDNIFENGGNDYCEIISGGFEDYYSTRNAALNMLNETEFKIGTKNQPYNPDTIGIYMSDNVEDCKRAFIESVWEDNNDTETMEFYFPNLSDGLDEAASEGEDWKFDPVAGVGYDVSYDLDGEDYEESLRGIYDDLVDNYVSGDKDSDIDKDFEANFKEDYIRLNKIERDGKTVYAIVFI